jgi:thioredoxin reductase
MSEQRTRDYLIIGAGPAGLQLGYFFEQAQRDYLILDKGSEPGAFYDVLPRHRTILSINKRYTGYTDRERQLRYDWNSLLCDDEKMAFRHYSERYFPDRLEVKHYLVDFAAHFHLRIKYQVRICHVKKIDGDLFMLVDQQGEKYHCRRLIVATGLGEVAHIPPISGVELAEHYLTVSIDPQDYVDQRVLILGKGNAAFELANSLTETARVIHLCSPESVKLAWETHFMGHVRALNNDFLDTYHLKGQNSVLDARVELIERRSRHLVAHVVYSHAREQRMEMAYDRIILCTGFRFDASFFDETCRPHLIIKGKLPAMTHEWESTNIKNLYFAGTLMQARDFQKTMSNVVHGFRFNIRFLSQILACKYHQQPLPYTEVAVEPGALTEHVLKRVSFTASLFLQPGFLCGVLVIPEGSAVARYYEGVPVDYVHNSELGKHHHYYTITLEYGHMQGSPLSVFRDPDPAKAHQDVYLHPIIRRFDGSTLVCEHHIPEHLENNWLPGHRYSESAVILAAYIPDVITTEEMLDHERRVYAFFLQQL